MVCLSEFGWRVGTPAVGGLGAVTHLNEDDVMEENGRFVEARDKHMCCFLIFPPPPFSHWTLCCSDRPLFPPLCPALALGGWDTAIFAFSCIIQSAAHSRSQ